MPSNGASPGRHVGLRSKVQTSEKRTSNFPNECLGGCKQYLPKGHHFCKKCGDKKDIESQRSSKIDLSNGSSIVGVKVRLPSNRDDF